MFRFLKNSVVIKISMPSAAPISSSETKKMTNQKTGQRAVEKP